MIWLSRAERMTLGILGTSALAALALLLGLRHRPPLTIAGGPGPAQAAAWDARLSAVRRIDVNTASAEELARLPGVGPALAARIVGHRTTHGRFRGVEDLADVRGIGPRRVEALRGHVTAR